MFIKKKPNLIIGDKKKVELYCLNFIKKLYNIVNVYALKDLNLKDFFYCYPTGSFYKKSELEKVFFSLTFNSSNNESILLIEDAHLLGQNGNSFLKLFEELPNETYVILTTNNPIMVLETIKSRSFILNLNENDNDKNKDKYDNILNAILSINNILEIEKFILNFNLNEFETKVLLEKALKYSIIQNEKIKIREIEDLLKYEILPTMHKYLIKQLIMIFSLY